MAFTAKRAGALVPARYGAIQHQVRNRENDMKLFKFTVTYEVTFECEDEKSAAKFAGHLIIDNAREDERRFEAIRLSESLVQTEMFETEEDG